VAYLRTALQTGQDIFLLNEASENGLRITTTNKAPKGATTIDVNFTTPISYDVNSKVLIATYDIPNHIPIIPNLYLGVTTTKIYIKPDLFNSWNSTSIQSYSRDNLGSIQPSAYASRTKVYYSTFIPLGYKVTKFSVYSSANRPIAAFTCRITDDTTTVRGTGMSNTPQLITAWPSVAGEYFIISYEIGAVSNEIYGGLIEMQAI